MKADTWSITDTILTNRELTHLASFVSGKPASRATDKMAAVGRLCKVCLEKFQNTAGMNEILKADSCEVAFVLLKRKMLAHAKANKEPTTRLEHSIINGLNRKLIEKIETALDKGEKVMPQAQEAEATEGKKRDSKVKKPKEKKAPAKKAAAKKAAAKKPKEKKAGEKATRTSKYADQCIKPLVDDNPRKEGTHGHKSMKIILDNPGISVPDFLNKGGRMVDLRWDEKHKRVKLEKAA